MHFTALSSRARWASALALVGVLVIGGVAYAQIPDQSGTIHGCYKKSGGSLRVIDDAVTKCASGETSLNWRQTGERGLPGEPGPAGVSGYEIVTKVDNEPGSVGGFFGGLGADCPAGKKVLGGGALAATDSGGIQDGYQVLNSSPKADSGWRATFSISNPLHDPFVLTVYAICANVS